MKSGICHRLTVRSINLKKLPRLYKMGKVISVFEYDLLGVEKESLVGAVPLPPEVFDYLESISLTSEKGSQLLKLTSRSGRRLLQVQNYAGILYTPMACNWRSCPR